MPPFRDIRQSQAVRAFVKLGGVERAGKGSHRVIKMPNGVNVSVPAGIVKVGLLKSLIKSAECSEERFLHEIGR